MKGNGYSKGSMPSSGKGGGSGVTGSARSYPDKQTGKNFKVPCNAEYGVSGVANKGAGNYGSKGVGGGY